MSGQAPPNENRPRLFWEADLSPNQKLDLRKRLQAAHPAVFGTVEEVGAFLDRVDTAPSNKWTFAVNPKCACTTVKRLLFALEFGVPLTTRYQSPLDINNDGAAQRLSFAGVFRSLHSLPQAEAILESSLRLTTARHPVPRAISMFLYLCQSDRESHAMFVNDRLKLNALTGFDWTSDPGTVKGFAKFLDYIAECHANQPVDRIDFHFRRQVDTVRPAFFRPELVGIVGKLDAFWRALQERIPPAQKIELPVSWSNKTTRPDQSSTLLDKANLDRIRAIYDADFAWLGLEVGDWQPAPPQPQDTGAARKARPWILPFFRKGQS